MFARVGHLRGQNWRDNSRGKRRRVFLGVVEVHISFCQAGGVKVCSRVAVMRVAVMRGLGLGCGLW